jgi:hypothetical protein
MVAWCLTCLSAQILEQSVWVLGNLAGEGASSRDAVLAAGAIRPLGMCNLHFLLVGSLCPHRFISLFLPCPILSFVAVVCNGGDSFHSGMSLGAPKLATSYENRRMGTFQHM